MAEARGPGTCCHLCPARLLCIGVASCYAMQMSPVLARGQRCLPCGWQGLQGNAAVCRLGLESNPGHCIPTRLCLCQ